MVIQFPIIIQNGEVLLLQIMGNHEHIDQFITDLTNHEMEVALLQIGKYQTPEIYEDLTPRQREIYHKARSEGYYDVPRRITLTDLAKKEKISKSTLSMALQRIHKKVLGEAASIS